MRSAPLVALAALCLSSSQLPGADETMAKSRIVAASLFKNGLAVIQREVAIPAAGTYRLEDVPEPVHGTYWVEGPAEVETTVQMRDVDMPANARPTGNLQNDLAGKKVTIRLRGDNRAPIAGAVMELAQPPEEETPADARYRGYPYAGYAAPQPARFLLLQTAKGRVHLDLGEISSIEEEPGDAKVKRKRAVLVIAADKLNGAATIRVSYLSRGLSWAPSYRIDVSDPKTLALEQSAVIRNELADLDGAEVALISGFPSIQFGHVTSPLAARTSWSNFFQQLAQRPDWQQDLMGNAVSQQARAQGVHPTGVDLGATPTGEGVDLHYQAIGKRTLANGDTLALAVARAKAPYERIVEWLVADTRDEWGNPIDRRSGHRYQGPDADVQIDVPWDALKFKNPLPFPMTTGPAMVTANGHFNGQRSSTWVNVGEETMLPVTKALSVRTRSSEREVARRDGSGPVASSGPVAANGPDGRDLVWIGGRQFRNVMVEGELAVSNHRKEAIKLVIRRRFSGELVKADGSPASSLREEGVYSVNKRNELVWTFPLSPGEEKKLTYRYSVLVSH